ncbi:hypothetical protein EV359DRAFT_82825 [Lentinula novae-zelandiae]|nr:hypothetical protein EV359DRAFT_82825 [Lentinula novae-zelandiae]
MNINNGKLAGFAGQVDLSPILCLSAGQRPSYQEAPLLPRHKNDTRYVYNGSSRLNSPNPPSLKILQSLLPTIACHVCIEGCFTLPPSFPPISMIQIIHAVPTQNPGHDNAAAKSQRLGPPGKERSPNWILDFYGDNEYLDTDDKKVFERSLNHLVVSDIQEDLIGAHNHGIFSLHEDYEVGGINHAKDTVIAKAMLKIDNNAWGEVKALKGVDLYIDPGIANVRDEKIPVIVMKLVKGVSLRDTMQYQLAPWGTRLEIKFFILTTFWLAEEEFPGDLFLDIPITEARGIPGNFQGEERRNRSRSRRLARITVEA